MSAEHEASNTWVTPRLDVSVPNVARIYNYLLGGKDSFSADRDVAASILELFPDIGLTCQLNRDFLGRVATQLARAGITQFIDLGSGLPTRSNVHQFVKAVDPDARVVYVDYDPLVVRHCEVFHADGARGVAAITGDVRDPGAIITHPAVRRLIDFSQPVAILLFAVLHYVTDEENPGCLMAGFRDALAPGSYLALSHMTNENITRERDRTARQLYQAASAPLVPRSRAQILSLLDGLELAPPGLTDIAPQAFNSTRKTPALMCGAVARKPR